MKTNFENAVKMLIEGRCESILSVGSNIPYKIIDGMLTQAVFTETTGIRRLATDFLGEWECIGYRPEMETVEMLRFECPECGKYWAMCQPDKRCKCPVPAVKLSGTYQRPVKEKVMRRVDLGEVNFNARKVLWYSHDSVFAAENRPDEVVNKTGKMIFEYEE